MLAIIIDKKAYWRSFSQVKHVVSQIKDSESDIFELKPGASLQSVAWKEDLNRNLTEGQRNCESPDDLSLPG